MQLDTAPAPDVVEPVSAEGVEEAGTKTPAPSTEDAVKGALSRVRNKTQEAADKLKAAPEADKPETQELSPQQKGAETRRKNKEAREKAEAEAAQKAKDAEAKAKVKEAEARADAAEAKAAKTQDAAAEPKTDAPVETKPNKEAPPQFSKEAKAEWDATPDSVKDQVWRLDGEATKGIEKYREKAAKYEAVEPFERLAAQFQADLPTVLRDYANMSEMLRRNPAEGINYLAQRHGITLTDWAEQILGVQSNEAYKGLETENMQLRQENDRLRKIETAQVEQANRQNQAITDRIRLDTPDFDQLEPDIVFVLQNHKGLGDSPEERLRNAIRRARNLAGLEAPKQELPASVEPEAGAVASVEPEAKTNVRGSATADVADASNIPATAEEAVRKAFGRLKGR
ncbi:MAG: hypothetical protein AAGB16_01020 [Pseudomonadota bacterium]